MSNKRLVWQLVAGRSPAGAGTRAVFEWFEGLPSNLKFPLPKKKSFSWPDPPFGLVPLPPPYMQLSGSGPVAAQECQVVPLPFQVVREGSVALTGVWGQ